MFNPRRLAAFVRHAQSLSDVEIADSIAAARIEAAGTPSSSMENQKLQTLLNERERRHQARNAGVPANSVGIRDLMESERVTGGSARQSIGRVGADGLVKVDPGFVRILDGFKRKGSVGTDGTVHRQRVLANGREVQTVRGRVNASNQGQEFTAQVGAAIDHTSSGQVVIKFNELNTKLLAQGLATTDVVVLTHLRATVTISSAAGADGETKQYRQSILQGMLDARGTYLDVTGTIAGQAFHRTGDRAGNASMELPSGAFAEYEVAQLTAADALTFDVNPITLTDGDVLGVMASFRFALVVD